MQTELQDHAPGAVVEICSGVVRIERHGESGSVVRKVGKRTTTIGTVQFTKDFDPLVLSSRTPVYQVIQEGAA